MEMPQPNFPLIVDSPLAFDYDPHTGLLQVVAIGIMQRQATERISVPSFSIIVTLHLTPETSRRLLADIPMLEKLLAQASKGPAKPNSLQ